MVVSLAYAWGSQNDNATYVKSRTQQSHIIKLSGVHEPGVSNLSSRLQPGYIKF